MWSAPSCRKKPFSPTWIKVASAVLAGNAEDEIMSWAYSDESVYRIQLARAVLQEVICETAPEEERIQQRVNFASQILRVSSEYLAEVGPIQPVLELEDLAEALEFMAQAPRGAAFWAGLAGYLHWIEHLEGRLHGHLVTHLAPTSQPVH